MMSGRGNHHTGSKSVHIYNCLNMSFLTHFEKKSLKKDVFLLEIAYQTQHVQNYIFCKCFILGGIKIEASYMIITAGLVGVDRHYGLQAILYND